MHHQLPYTFSGICQPTQNQIYHQTDLERMTLLQLRDICEREKIINAAVNRMDREELIHLILRFRGSRQPRLIGEPANGGLARLEAALSKAQLTLLPHKNSIPAKITVYDGLDTNYFDGYSVPYDAELDGVNAAVTDSAGNICALLRLEAVVPGQKLFLTRCGKQPCREAALHYYKILLFPRKLSDLVSDVYEGRIAGLPPQIKLYSVPLMGFFVRQPEKTAMPLAIDFGTSNTVAGLFIDNAFHSKISDGIHPGQLAPGVVNYVNYLDNAGEVTPILPSVVGVDRIEQGKVSYSIGIDAERTAGNGYMGEGLCIFYDLKRWVSSYNDEEELADYRGSSLLVPRKLIIQAFLRYVIDCAEQRFKCIITNIYLPYPVKQRERFITLYREILPEYNVAAEDSLDEGVSVIYSTIASFIDSKQFEDGAWYKALIIDCGGGTTDLSSCEFSIRDERVAYTVDIETAYENGDTDFGGNNLTFRIMQLIKIAAARELTGQGESVEQLTADMDTDLFRLVDERGVEVVYERLEAAYAVAEAIIPTRFKDYEYKSRDEYYMVKNNFYLLFSLAEKAKKIFFSFYQLLRVVIGSAILAEDDRYRATLPAPRWKLAVNTVKGLAVQKEFPTVILNTAIVKMVLKANIYDIIRRFLSGLYDERQLNEYNIIKLTGQSCKISLFRDCIKEFIPGRLIQQRPGSDQSSSGLKLCCLEGAIRYISDRRMGYAKVNIKTKMPALPYRLSAQTHKGERETLVHSLDRDRIYGSVSRSLESVELKIWLENADGDAKYVHTIYCDPKDFRDVTYDEISELYADRIPQDEADVIENGEVRYFVWADKGQWGFSVVPLLRSDEQLRIGDQQLFPFENDSWIVNYFDGTR